MTRWKDLTISFLIGLAVLAILSAAVTSILFTTFNNSLSSENLTFTGNQNITRYIDIYRYGNVTGAYLNLSGGFSEFCYQESANVSNQQGTDGDCNLNYSGTITEDGEWLSCFGSVIDGLWAGESCGKAAGPESSEATISYNKPLLAKNNSLWTIMHGSGTAGLLYGNVSISEQCWNYSLTNITFRLVAGSASLAQCWNGTGWVTLSSLTYGWWEEAMVWSIDKSPINLSVIVNTSMVYNFTGTFNQTNNRTSDMKLAFNASLDNGACTGGALIGNNCSIPLLFHSDTAGTLEISDIDVTWQEYTKPNLTVTAPNTTFDGFTYIPLNFTAVDDYALDKCFYNVTRGASLEKETTYTSCYANTTFTVSGDATYVVNLCVNDTSGNQNCTDVTFKTISYVPPVYPSGSGGSGSVIVVGEESTWSMETESKTGSYQLSIGANTVRSKDLLFNNNGKNVLTVKLKATGKVAEYVSFEDDTITLPVLKDIQTRVPFMIEVPEGTPKGVYTGNIEATATDGSYRIISLQVTVGSLSTFLKLTAARRFGDVVIPYFLLSLIGASLGGLGGWLVFRNNRQIGMAVTVLIAVASFFLPLFLF